MHTTTDAVTAAVFPIYMQAGGVGKTTLTANLGALLAQLGYRVLLVDLDVNGRLTPSLGFERAAGGTGLTTALAHGGRWSGDPLSLVREHADGMHVIPADEDRSMLDVMLAGERAREFRLTQLLARFNGLYDVVLIDTQPGESIAIDNVLLASANRGPGRPSGTIIPVNPDLKCWEDLPKTLAHLRVVSEIFGVPIEPLGVVVNKYDWRDGLAARQFAALFRQEAGVPVLATVNRLGKVVADADRARRPAVAYAPDARVSAQFRDVLAAITGQQVPA